MFLCFPLYVVYSALYGIFTIITAGGLQVELGDSEVEHEVEHQECCSGYGQDR